MPRLSYDLGMLARSWFVLLGSTLMACGAVPDLTFADPDAASDANGGTMTDGGSLVDVIVPEVEKAWRRGRRPLR